MARGFGVEHLSPEQRRYVPGYEGDDNAGKTGSQEQAPPPFMDFRTPVANGSPEERRAGDAEKMQVEWRKKGDARDRKSAGQESRGEQVTNERGDDSSPRPERRRGSKERVSPQEIVDANLRMAKARIGLASSREEVQRVINEFNEANGGGEQVSRSMTGLTHQEKMGEYTVAVWETRGHTRLSLVEDDLDSPSDKVRSGDRMRIVENDILPGGKRRTVHRRVPGQSPQGQGAVGGLESAYDKVVGFLGQKIFGGKEQKKAPELEAVTIERPVDMPQFLNSLTGDQYLSLPAESQRVFAKIYREANADNTGTTEEIQQLVREHFAGEQKYFPLMVDMLKREANLMTRKIRPEDIERYRRGQ